jgi:hypothetical protein
MSEDGIPLDDIARHVGHASATKTAGYVRSHAARDKAPAKPSRHHPRRPRGEVLQRDPAFAAR